MQRTLQSVVTGGSENCLSDTASRPANSASGCAQRHTQNAKAARRYIRRSGRFVGSARASAAGPARA